MRTMSTWGLGRGLSFARDAVSPTADALYWRKDPPDYRSTSLLLFRSRSVPQICIRLVS